MKEYCSPLWAGSPASRLAQLDVVETKAFNIIGIFSDGAESMSLSLHHCRQVGGLSVLFYHLLSGLAPSALSMLCPPSPLRFLQGTHGPPSPTSRETT